MFVMMQETVWENGVDSIKCLGHDAECAFLVDCEYVVGMADVKWGKRALKVKDELCKRTSNVTDYLGRSACRLFFHTLL